MLESGDFADHIFKAAEHGEWFALAVFLLIASVWTIRKVAERWGSRFPKLQAWVLSDFGGFIVKLTASLTASVTTALSLGHDITPGLVFKAIVAGFMIAMAAGGTHRGTKVVKAEVKRRTQTSMMAVTDEPPKSEP